MKQPSCKICKRILIENDQCLGLMYGKIKKEYDGFIADDDDLPDVICMNCESVIYDAIDEARKKSA